MSTPSQQLTERAAAHLMATYPAPRAAFVRGKGTALFDLEGRVHLDFLCGLGVTNLGHAHPAVTAAVAEQAGALVHTSNLFVTEPAVALAERLSRILAWDDAKVFFAQCGATANEAAIKLARRHGKRQHADKTRIVTLEGSFHGRTLATLEATGQPAKHLPFAPLAGFVDHVPYDDVAALRRAVTQDTCAVLLEVVQGEGGVRPVAEEVLAAAREACDAVGALLIVDEVQTGIGRTGPWFAFQDTPVVPDVVTMAKALANGLPIGACVARGAAADALGTGEHGTTFGGNPVTCAAANAVIDTITTDGILPAARTRARRLRQGLEALVGTTPYASGVRGRGLLLGLELDAPVAAAVEAACGERLLVVNAVAPDVVRLAPPLTVSRQELDQALKVLAEALAAVAEPSAIQEV
ncbi:acetylornithine transaminase [Egicoccus halophilus]|uniref:Acetylornithine aminotransferase n=1 Tax=Egicoccus halophilus TaxID=1670830 RepID=A0A8J3EV69_9ACTN|nr:acetylornithine transaminase [Egicoccus halophilus]GGI07502.1 acetylornithine aminotransferase [Egicoccus halophilus]